MADLEPIESISTRSRHVRQNFLRLESLLEELQHDKSTALSPAAITDALGRFSLWAGNMGAIHDPKRRLSLDYRLSEAAEIREQIGRQLDEIVEALGDLTRIALETSPNRVTALQAEDRVDAAFPGDGFEDAVANDYPLDEFHMIVKVIAECINSLFRIGILIRRATPRDRFKRALEASNAVFPDGFDIEHVRQKHRKIGDSWLWKRLGSAMAKRRQFISYCRDHHARLGTEENVESNDGTTTKLSSSKATTFDPQHNLVVSPQEEADDLVDNDMMSLGTASTTLDSLSILKLPPLSSLSKDQQPFECPICFTLQSFKSEKSWRLHAFQDLKAYVCTLGQTGCETELFGDRDSWFEHEVNNHRAGYSCALCHQSPFSPETLGAHILATHGHFSSHQLELLRDASRKPPVHFKASDCPFCDDWHGALQSRINLKGKAPAQRENSGDILVSPGRFKRHVATHQEQLAIFTIPTATEEDDSAATAPDLGSETSGEEDVGDLSDASGTGVPLIDDEPLPEVHARMDDVEAIAIATRQTPPQRSTSPSSSRLTKGQSSPVGDKSPSPASTIVEGVSDITSLRNSSTGPEADTDDEIYEYMKPQMVRKTAGELVRPALRPPSSRRPSSMPGTPTFSKAVHFDSHLDHIRHFLQVDRPLAVSAGSTPSEKESDDDADYPFAGDTTFATIKDTNKHDKSGQDAKNWLPKSRHYVARRGLDLDQSVDDYLGDLESKSAGIKLKGIRSSAKPPSDGLSSRLSSPSGQAFANRYDFSASLTAAIQNAKEQLSDSLDGVHMKASRKATPAPEDHNNPTGIQETVSEMSQAQPRPPDNDPPTGISSVSYEELVDKYCFTSAKTKSPEPSPTFLAPARPGNE
ncbi:hypothetical protein B0T25DRAFT_53590 [Lasiosphaeria hispida]|uniref:Oxidoreductase acuF-like C2H2 type zinc-finger domain-containing protein n=1 Tax=Lasiosphaeria hispida TaxID=260671 RepID=A0AAJ0MKP0_9PEZI|nr:hypothetical protein B0T25DRAFT_53590 [Lasiosphaeria hispida]